MKKNTIQKMVTSAIMAALAVILTWLEIQVGPAGGSINIVMVPIILIAYRYGVSWGIATGLVVGLVKCIIGGGIGWGLPSILLDYVLAYGAVGLAGVTRKMKFGLPIGALIGALSRFVIHFISGITIYAIATSTEIAGIVTSNSVLFSVIYNGLYMLPSTVIVVIVALIIMKPVDKYFKNRK